MSSNRTRRISSNSKGIEMTEFPDKKKVNAIVRDYYENKNIKQLKNAFKKMNRQSRSYFEETYRHLFNLLNTTSILSLRYSAGKRRKTNKRRNNKK
jgi:hypothetical protein